MALRHIVLVTSALAALAQGAVNPVRRQIVVGSPTVVLVPAKPSIVRPPDTLPDEISTCNRWHEVRGGDVCYRIVDQYPPLTLEELYSYNPYIDEYCSNLFPGQNICVGVSSGPQLPEPTKNPDRPEGTMPGVVQECTKFHLVKDSENCNVITADAGISLDDFYKWNTQVDKTCTNLWRNYYVCIGV